MSSRPSEINIEQLPLNLALARKIMFELASECGQEMLANFGGAISSELKSDDSPVSRVDLRNNQRVIDTITKYFPSHSIVGEEAGIDNSSDFSWVCDPVDGTCPYIAGIPTSVFALALTYCGTTIMAVIDDPYNGGRRYFAELGKGATVNGQKLSVNSNSEVRLSNIYLDDYQMAHFKFDTSFRSDLQQQGAYCWQFFSIAYPSCKLAEGIFSAAIFSGTKPWDIAAAKLIVEEAGGKVTDLYGQEQRYDQPINGALLSNGVLHDLLLSGIKGKVRVR